MYKLSETERSTEADRKILIKDYYYTVEEIEKCEEDAAKVIHSILIDFEAALSAGYYMAILKFVKTNTEKWSFFKKIWSLFQRNWYFF